MNTAEVEISSDAKVAEARAIASMEAISCLTNSSKYKEILNGRKIQLMTNNLVLAGMAAITVTGASLWSWYFSFVGMAIMTAFFFISYQKSKSIDFHDDFQAMVNESRYAFQNYLQQVVFAKYGKNSPFTGFGITVQRDSDAVLRERILISGSHITHGRYKKTIVVLVFNDSLTSLKAQEFEFSDLGKR